MRIISKKTKKVIGITLFLAILITSINFPAMPVHAETTKWQFDYTGNIQTWEVPRSGRYFIQAKGAAGGGVMATNGLGAGAPGGVVSGYIELEKGTTLYIAVGGMGGASKSGYAGGWNGGGNAYVPYGASGGGATSIQTSLIGDGQLKNYASKKSDVMLAVGGGAGLAWQSNIAENTRYFNYQGKNYYYDFEGIATPVLVGHDGSGEKWLIPTHYCYYNSSYGSAVEGAGGTLKGHGLYNTAPTQSTGYAFGQGEAAYNKNNNGYSSGAGGGYYGGYAVNTNSYSAAISAGGSGYYDNRFENVVINDGHGYYGSVSIEYTPLSSSLLVELNGFASYDGEQYLVALQGNEFDEFDLSNIILNDNCKFVEWQIKEGDGQIVNGKFIFGKKSTAVKLICKADIRIEESYGSFGSNVLLDLRAWQSDSFTKKFKLYESKDNSDFRLLSDSDTGSSTIEPLKYNYSRNAQVFTAPLTGLYNLTCYGGGTSYGRGGSASGRIFLTAGTPLYVYVGKGADNTGWNGSTNGVGAYSLTSTWLGKTISTSTNASGNWSSGATDIRVVESDAVDGWSGNDSLLSRIVTAGGGGGIGYKGHCRTDWSGGQAMYTTDNPPITLYPNNTPVSNGVLGRGSRGYFYYAGGTWYGENWSGTNRNFYAPSNHSEQSTSFKNNGAGGGGYYGGSTGNSNLRDNTVSYAGTSLVQSYTATDGKVYEVTNGTTVAGTSSSDGYAMIHYLASNNADFSAQFLLEDNVAPDIPELSIISCDNVNIKYEIIEPKDRGSAYSYKLESYDSNSGEMLSTHTTEKKEITSGIKGYYYYIDTNPVGTVTKNHTFTDTKELGTTIKENTEYLHIAAIDNAGHLGKTLTIKILPIFVIKYNGNNESVNKYSDKVSTKFTGAMTDQEILQEESAKILESLYQKEGYIFQNWNTKADGTGETFEVDQNVTYDEMTQAYGRSVTLYAQWEPITYTVKYNGNKNWNTSQTSYTQSMRFDKPETLLANKFKRTPNFTIGGVELKQGYNFVGWAWKSNTTWTKKYKDLQGPEVFNMTTTDKDVINLYAIWEKPITLTFDMNGGHYNESAEQVKLSAKIYNANYSYDFNINNTKRAKSTNNWTEQVGTIDAYGTIVENGMNNKYTKVDSYGKQYRFIGWSTNPNSKKPDGGLEPFVKKQSTYKIYDDTTLYAVWEPILQVQLQLDRTLGNLNESLPNRVVATAITENPEVALVIKPGEQGSYTVNSRGNITLTDVSFDRLITDIYDYQGGWTDNLNPNPTTSDDRRIDNIPLSQTHGLNRQPSVANGNSMVKKFYIPQYLGTKQLEGLEKITGKQHVGIDTYGVTFTFANTDSYYWKEVKKNPNGEQIQIKGYIYLPTKIGPDGKPSIPSILDDLRTKLKIRLH